MPELRRRMRPTTPEPPDLREGRGWRSCDGARPLSPQPPSSSSLKWASTITAADLAATTAAAEPRGSLHYSPRARSERGKRGGGGKGREEGRAGTKRRLMATSRPETPLDALGHCCPLPTHL